MNQRILIFGGAFSPPTLAHEAIVAACLALSDFDQVWLSPSGNRADKRIALPDVDRLRMLDIVRAERFADDPRLRIVDIELRLPLPTRLYSTVQELRVAYPGADFSFALGADAYAAMSGWYRGKELQQQLSLIVFTSQQNIPASKPNIRYMLLDEVHAETSSTDARQALANGDDLSMLVSEPIARYLYRISN